MKELPLVSVITPVYNAEKYIALTIESILQQTYKNLEIIIVDDCSQDHSAEIIKSYAQVDKRINFIASVNNSGGPARPRNIGLKAAKGKYIAFLDSDDLWLPNKIEEQIKFLEENPQYALIDSRAYTINENNDRLGTLGLRKIHNVLRYFFKDKFIINFSNFININSVVIRNVDLPSFNEDTNLNSIEDWLFWICNLKKDKKIYTLDKYLMEYRVVSNSISSRSTDMQYRRIFYMYSSLFLKHEISAAVFFLCFLFNYLKLMIRKYVL